ncbi:MAG TPA: site-specific integrase [Chthoniobacterales bacterium]|nr:site-specific integrase [Chthoniobacterales bacterium]
MIPESDTDCLKNSQTTPTKVSSPWHKSSVANLVRYGPSGVYFARFKVGGKLIRKSLRTKLLSIARNRLTEQVTEARSHSDLGRKIAKGKITFGEVAETYLRARESDPDLKPRSKEYRRACLAAIRKTWPSIDALDVRRISKGAVRDWAATLRANGTGFRANRTKSAHKGISAGRFNNTVATLRQILDLAIEEGALHTNSARAIKRMKERAKELSLPSRSQFADLVRIVETSGAARARHCADLIRFLAFSGCRLGEAQQVQWRDVDWEKSELIIRGDLKTGTKNWGIRRVSMIPELDLMLRDWRQRRFGETPETAVLCVKECQRSLDRACKTLCIQKITHHDLRHLFATMAIESGIDIPTVARLLGHRDGGALAMRVYGHLRQQHAREQVQKIRFNLSSPENVVSFFPRTG